MHQSGKEKIAVQPEQQLLGCSAEEAVSMTAAALCVDEVCADYSSFSELLKRQPRKTFR